MHLIEGVVVTQGDIELTANKATVKFSEDTQDVEQVSAIGNVKILKESKPPEDKITGEAQEAVFFPERQVVILKKKAKITKGNDTLKGDLINYNIASGNIKVESVSGVLLPENSE